MTSLAKTRAQAAAKYKPKRTRVLFIAEAPPDAEDRYFYFENVDEQDWLWLGLMKALFPNEFGKTSDERKRKAHWLARFRDCGYHLIDAVKEPLSGTKSQNFAVIKANIARLSSEVRDITADRIVLIKANVHAALYRPLIEAGLNVLNKQPLPFPSSGQQTKFHERVKQLVEPLGKHG